MRGGLAAMLEEGVRRVRLGQSALVCIGQVDIVEGEGYDGEGIGRRPKGGLQC